MSAELHRILDEQPRDWDTRLVLADWYEANGDLERALFQRFLVERKLSPTKDGSGSIGWDWWEKDDYRVDGHVLPDEWWEQDEAFVTHGPVNDALYSTFVSREEAEEALLVRLLKLEVFEAVE